VNANDRSLLGQPDRFHTTCWSAILLSAQSETPDGQDAREKLCRLYWRPIYAYVRSRGHNPIDAEDLTQGFFLSLLERKAFREVAPQKGKFRSFLLACLKHYLSNEIDRANMIKRGRDITFVSFDLRDSEERYANEPTDELTADEIFDARWGLTLMKGTIERLKEEYQERNKTAEFEALQPFLDSAGRGQDTSTCDSLAQQLNLSLGGAKTAIHRFRRRYTEMLREAVAQTVTDPADIDDEIRALCNTLITAKGRVEP
jgi:RNA polymerase sigma factor (sigma-70 family)